MVHDTDNFEAINKITAGGQTFTGYVVSASMGPIPKSVGWFETHVTLIATT
jgi:hypothetical protein